MRRVNRRSFLAGAAATALGAFGRPVRAAAPVDVIVIGAGLAGLHAAWLLESQGARVTVLEGSERLGGRVHTADGVHSRPEYGASQIGRSYARVIATAHRLDLALVPEDRNLLPFGAHLRGRWVTAAQWPRSDMNPLPDDLRATPAPRTGDVLVSRLNPLKSADDWLDPRFASLDVSVAELLGRSGVSAAALELASLTTPSMTQVSALALMQEQNRGRLDRAFGASEPPPPHPASPAHVASSAAPISNIGGGSTRLIEAMAGALKGPVLRRRVVGGIDLRERRVRVDCLEGSRFESDFVISAVPFSMLQRIRVQPDFIGPQLRAVQTMPMLGTTRAYLAIRKPFWHADGLDPSFLSDGIIEMFWAIDNHQGNGEHRGVMVMTGERAARLDDVPPGIVPQLLLEELARLRPASRGKVEVLTWNSWSATRLIGCCRHMYGPGQITEFAREMILPWHRLHLAGEHTRRNDFGMEAAMESGERAALEILSAAA